MWVLGEEWCGEQLFLSPLLHTVPHLHSFSSLWSSRLRVRRIPELTLDRWSKEKKGEVWGREVWRGEEREMSSTPVLTIETANKEWLKVSKRNKFTFRFYFLIFLYWWFLSTARSFFLLRAAGRRMWAGSPCFSAIRGSLPPLRRILELIGGQHQRNHQPASQNMSS